ncbi:hypothetical protein BGW39_000624 [Mortierella sp. 14UC]|nr:hypothetical protein BGW39_000624 [Mortierella sp. 14UC]
MATIHNHIDPSSISGAGTAPAPWLSTYSRALSSIYGTDEDHCWDYLLSSTLESSISRSNTPSNNSNNSLYYNNINQDAMMASTLGPLSPASLSHALCKIGFDCIDYFTATQLDDDDDEDDTVDAAGRTKQRQPQTPTSSPTAETTYSVYTNPMLDELTDSDWRTGLAAAVCGKRTAALERKRVLSRTMSQEFLSAGGVSGGVKALSSSSSSSSIAPLTAANIATAAVEFESSGTNNTDTNGVISNEEEGNSADRRRKRDPWFEALDRLARWDEVAYR